MSKNEEARITLRLYLQPEIFFGPGKADVLRGIRETGSISGTGRLTGMSYKRTWQLVDRMNHDFREPLVQTNTGGPNGGGASLTPAGEKALALYERIMDSTRKAISKELGQLGKMVLEKNGA